MVDFVNERSKIDISYFAMLEKINATIMRPTLDFFDRLKSACLHPATDWKLPDQADCHWPGDKEIPAQSNNGHKRYVWIRHDVDDHIDLAWKMALAENERGISSVYFFLNTASYFRWAAFLDIAKDFVKAGHTIGLHNNSVTSAYKDGDIALAEKILQRDLSYLRSAGEVWITASHGDVWNRHYNILNYEMFTECRRKGTFPHKPMAHYGLKYEAYSTPHTYYLGDSGGRWSGFDRNGKRHTVPFDIINLFNSDKSGVMQLLVHPQWWKEIE